MGTELLKIGKSFNLNQRFIKDIMSSKTCSLLWYVQLVLKRCQKVIDALAAFTDVAQWRFVLLQAK
jgi:hypothetical protein